MSEDKEMDRQMSQSMNPRVRVLEVGIRTLRKIKIYPLSVADQFTLSDSITEGIQIYAKESSENLTPESVSKLVDLVRKKLPDILRLIVPDEKVPAKLLKELDNYQLAEIAQIVFEDNYGEPVKKLVSLFRPTTQGNESALGRLSQLSAGTTPATDSNTSPDSVTKKVE
jgi:hypothetical protein